MNVKKILTLSLFIVALSLIFIYAKSAADFTVPSSISPFFSLGFLIIVAHLAGLIAKETGLPMLTGNLLAGVLFGPYVLDFITVSDISALELINSLALSFIAITAGGELKIASLKKNAFPILSITVTHTIVILAGMTGFFYFLFSYFPITEVNGGKMILVISILFGTIAVAKSPASTIAIINEYKAKGSFTDVVLGVTMLKDIVVLLLFAVVMAFVSGYMKNQPVSPSFLWSLLGHIFISVVAGIVFGVLIILFFKYITKEISIFIVLAAFVSHDIASVAGLEHMLLCMVAGFVVQNFSKQGHIMIEAIEGSYLPIYVIFFSIAGAGLDFSYFKTSILVISSFVLMRIFFVYLATYIGASVSKAPDSVKKYAWTGFLTNAGLTLSMIIIINDTFPKWGGFVKAVVISIIAVNQIAGPVLFKYGLLKSGETMK
jgi:Kef-type K+ transport system membrane component KefB